MAEKQAHKYLNTTQKSAKAGRAAGPSFGRRNGPIRKLRNERKEERKKKKIQRKKGGEDAPSQGAEYHI